MDMNALWKLFRNCMYSFREKWEANFKLRQSICRFNRSWLQFEWNLKYLSSAILSLRHRLLIAPWHGFHLLEKGWLKRFVPTWRDSSWFGTFSFNLLLFVCCFIYPAKTTNFKSCIHFFSFYIHLLRNICSEYF